MRPESYYQRIGSVMLDNKYDRTTANHRSGTLGKKLYKVTYGSTRVFDRREERKNKHYWVVIVVDESGSMHGSCYPSTKYPNDKVQSKIKVAAQSISHIANALEKHSISFAVVGFNQFIRIHKSFDDKFSAKDFAKMQSDMVKASGSGAQCNHDLIAMYQTLEMIRCLPPENTITMVFVDGCPACGCKCGASDRHGSITLKGTAELVAKRSKMITFEIGCGRTRRYYPNVVTINSPSEFLEESIYAIQTAIQRG